MKIKKTFTYIRYLIVAFFMVTGLGACLATPVKLSPAAAREIHSIVIVPVESPPLEITPDLFLEQQPAYVLMTDSIPLDMVLERKVYRGPGDVLIAGLTDQEDIHARTPAGTRSAGTGHVPRFMPLSSSKKHWDPNLLLAQQISERLQARGIRVLNCGCVYQLPIARGVWTANQAVWSEAIRAWYNSSIITLEHNLVTGKDVDAVLMVGLGDYAITQSQTTMQVLLSLVDPSSGKLKDKAHARANAVQGTAQDLLDQDASRFKQLVADLGSSLVTTALRHITL